MTRLTAAMTFIVCFLASAGIAFVGRQWLTRAAAVAEPAEQVAAVAPPPIATTNPPHLVLDQTRSDAGDIPRGEPAKFAFVLKNEGVGPLVIAAKAGCGCTVVHYEKQIPPGGQGKLEAELRTQNLHDAVTKSIDVQTNDPKQPKVQLHLAARIVSAVEVLPSDHPVFSLNLTGKTVQELRLQTAPGNEVEVTEVKCSEPYVQASLGAAEEVEGRRNYKLVLTIQPEAPLGKSDLRLTLSTTAKLEREITITARCEKGIIVAPASIQLTAPRAGGPPAKWSVLLTKREGSFHVQNVASSDPHLEARAEAVKEGSCYRLAVTYRGELADLTAPTSITVATDDPEQPKLEIPIRPLARKNASQPVEARTAASPPASSSQVASQPER